MWEYYIPEDDGVNGTVSLAWEQLSEEDRYCLETFFGDENTYGSNTTYQISKYLYIEQTTADKIKNRTLDRLIILLLEKLCPPRRFGKENFRGGVILLVRRPLNYGLIDAFLEAVFRINI